MSRFPSRQAFRPLRPFAVVAIVLAACAGTGSPTADPELERCAPVERFLVEAMGMAAETGRDTVDDWRTRRMLPGCRVTAAGSTALGMGPEAELMYERLGAAGWTRTPDPRDAPGEAALRYRLGETDCFFSIYSGIMIGTEAEIRVTNEYGPGPGEERYNVLVQCVEAMEAAPRAP